MAHLLHVELARQNRHVGKPGVEAQGLRIADVELRGEVHLDALLPTVGHHGHVGGDDCAHAGLRGGVDDLVHALYVAVVDDGVDRQVALHAPLAAHGGYLAQVVEREVIGRVGAHIQFVHAEVDGVGPGLKGGHERVA